MQSFEVRLCKWDYFGGHGYRIRAVQVSLFDRDQSAICATKSNQLSFPKSCRKHPAGALTDRRLRSGLRLQEHVEASQQRGRMKSTVVIDQLLANDGGATHRQRLECLHEKTSTCRDIPVVQDHRAMMLQYDDIVGVHAARPNEDAVAYQQRLQKALAPSVDRVRSLMGKIAEVARRLGDASASRGFVDSNMAVAARSVGRTRERPVFREPSDSSGPSPPGHRDCFRAANLQGLLCGGELGRRSIVCRPRALRKTASSSSTAHPPEVVARETGLRDRRHLREVFIRKSGVPPRRRGEARSCLNR
jgi:hypothetical protein